MIEVLKLYKAPLKALFLVKTHWTTFKTEMNLAYSAAPRFAVLFVNSVLLTITLIPYQTIIVPP